VLYLLYTLHIHFYLYETPLRTGWFMVRRKEINLTSHINPTANDENYF